MQLRYAFRLYPDAAQQAALARAFGCARVVFNDAVRAREDARKAGKPFPTAGQLSTRLITQAKRTAERAWLGEVSAVVLQQSLRDAGPPTRLLRLPQGHPEGATTGPAPVQVTQGRPAVDPVHRQRPLEHHRRRPSEPAEDRSGEGEGPAPCPPRPPPSPSSRTRPDGTSPPSSSTPTPPPTRHACPKPTAPSASISA
ncbi:helix-turn-helix domain-containing protein [Streptomyces sp. SLBN-31]|uniref:helix-turn-helix domain-containing protein n=1 Tax=Streptomyces sp. SLBN-31 TaxID=2768444 RepID=UPI0037D9B981